MVKSSAEELERGQYRATEIVRGCKNMAYKDRWKDLGWFNLTEKRLRGELITCLSLLETITEIMELSRCRK